MFFTQGVDHGKQHKTRFCSVLSTPIPLKSGQEGYAMYCYSSYGPKFGGQNYSDLYICNAPNSNCSTYLNRAYQCPSGQNPKVFLTGSQCFRVSEMEVYRL